MKLINKIFENKEESTFLKLWQNKRTHAAIVLGLWMIFLFFVITISYIGGSLTKEIDKEPEVINKEESQYLDYEDMKKNLINSNYSYNYDIKIGGERIIFKGEKLKNIETGYRETKDGTIKYQIDNSGIYKVLMDDLEPIDDLFLNIDTNYLNLEYLFKTLEQVSFMEEKLDQKRTFTYTTTENDIQYKFVITTDLTNITKIEINYSDVSYLLEYSNLSVEKVN